MLKRKIVSTFIVIIFLVLFVTAIWMYIKPFTKPIASLHTFAGLLFIVLAGIHIFNNSRSLKKYLFPNQSRLRFSKFFFLCSILTVTITWSIFKEHSWSNWVYEFGNAYRAGQSGKIEFNPSYEIIDIQQLQKDITLEVEIKKGPAFKYPLFVIWLENQQGDYLRTLYVSNSIASSTFTYGSQAADGTWRPDIVRRPEALPYWSHKRGKIAKDGLLVPLENSQDLDAVSGATPTNNFILKTGIEKYNLSELRILMEVNQSYDWNDYFTADKFPEDPIYSGSGQVGQPALVYEGIVSLDNITDAKHFILEPIGHSHYSGKDGKLYSDLSVITTAKDIVERAVLTLSKNEKDIFHNS